MKRIISSIAISIAMLCMFTLGNPQKASAADDCRYVFLTSCGGEYNYKGTCGASDAVLIEIMDYHQAECE